MRNNENLEKHEEPTIFKNKPDISPDLLIKIHDYKQQK